MSKAWPYKINNIQEPLLGMNRVDDRWNMHERFYYDLKNGYLTKSAKGQTLIKQRYGLKKISSLPYWNAYPDIKNVQDYPGIRKLLYWDKTSTFYGCSTPSFNQISSGFWKLKLAPTTGAWEEITSTSSGMMGNELIKYGDYLIKSRVDDPSDCPSKFFFSDMSYSILSTDSNLSAFQKLFIHNGRIIGMQGDITTPVVGSKVNGALDSNGWSADQDWFSLDISKFYGEYATCLGGITLFKNIVALIYSKIIILFEIPINVQDINFIQIIDIIPLSSGDYNGVSDAGTPHAPIVKVGNEWIVATKTGIKSLSIALSDGRYDANDLTKNIDPFYDSLINWMYYGEGDFENLVITKHPITEFFPAQMIFYPRHNQIWLSLPQRVSSYITGIGTADPVNDIVLNDDNPTWPSQVLIYDVKMKEIVGRFEFPFNITAFCIGPNQDLYIAGDNGYLFKYDEDTYVDEILSTGLAGNTVIPFSFKPAYIGSDTPHNFKILNSLTITAETNQATDLTLNYNIQPIADKGDAALTAISETVSLASGVGQNYDYDLIGRGKIIDLELTHSVSGSRVSLGEIKVNTDLEGEI